MTFLKTKILLPGLCIFGIILLFITNPRHVPVYFLIVPFIIFFAVLLLSAKKILPRVNGYQIMPKRSKAIIRGLIASYPVISLLLMSLGQLSLRDFLILTVLFLALGIYTRRVSVS